MRGRFCCGMVVAKREQLQDPGKAYVISTL